MISLHELERVVGAGIRSSILQHEDLVAPVAS